jgi:RNA polymerase sigma factor (sigma-70 family)
METTVLSDVHEALNGIRRGSHGKRREAFEQTRWTLVQRAMSGEPKERFDAISEICRIYWDPLYCFARRLGHSCQDAEDETQGFFAWLLSADVLHGANQQRGRLRTFLLHVFRQYLSHERAHAAAWRRGGRIQFVPFDAGRAEAGLNGILTDNCSPEAVYERKWALAVTRESIRRLGALRHAAGKGALFEALRPFLQDDRRDDGLTLRNVGETLGMDEGAVRTALHRLRKRHREMVLEVVGESLHTRDLNAVREELHSLCAAVA